MIIHPDRLDEMLLAPREAFIAKAEIKELVHAYRGEDMVPRSRLKAVEAELAQAVEALKGVQKVAHAEITTLTDLFRHATGYTPDGYMRMLEKVKAGEGDA